MCWTFAWTRKIDETMKYPFLPKNQKFVGSFVVLGAALVMVAGGAYAQELISNGDFESWESVVGEPPEGIPMNWSISSSTAPPVQGPGIAKGASHSVVLVPGPGNQIVQGVRGRPVAALIEVVFAATEPQKSDGRSFSMNLAQAGLDAPYVNFRVVQGNSAGKLTLEAFNGKFWEEIAGDIFESSEYDPETNTFSVLKPQILRISIDFDAEWYSISCGPDASKLKHFPKLTIFQSEGGGGGLSSVTFRETLNN